CPARVRVRQLLGRCPHRFLVHGVPSIRNTLLGDCPRRRRLLQRHCSVQRDDLFRCAGSLRPPVWMSMGWVNDQRQAQREQLTTILRRRLTGEVHADPGTLGLYTMDASNYRHVPLAVVLPRSLADIEETVTNCRELGVSF